MSNDFLTTYSVAKRLLISHRSLMRMVRNRTIPYQELPNGKIRFDQRELDAWLETLKREACSTQ